jgi:hypothetical protein
MKNIKKHAYDKKATKIASKALMKAIIIIFKNCVKK